MKLKPEDTQALRETVALLDRLDSLIQQTETEIDQAAASIQRLTASIADIRQTEAERATQGMVPDAARITAIMAGKSPALLDKAEIAARAEQSRIAQAHIQQLSLDVAAIERRRATREAHLANLRKQKDAATGTFLEQFADAGMTAYREASIAFVKAHMPAMQAIASATILRDPTRNWPTWWGSLSQGLRVHWHTGAPPNVETVSVWPRGSHTALVCGTPLLGAEGVPALIDAVRQGAQEF